MANVKKKLKWFGRYVWEIVKASLPSLFMYICAGLIMFMLMSRSSSESTEFKMVWKTSTKIWTIVCIVAAAAYNGLICWAHGGSHYEQLVSGNVKRSTEDAYGNPYKMSSHKEAKEYRVWKGFTFGAITAILTIATGIVFGCMQSDIDANGLNAPTMILTLISGWSVLPFYASNFVDGTSISYFITIAFALVPVVISGVFYIIGAYARRNKVIRQQQIADQASKDLANKPKKINYGGLPGTKPKKRK
ncbi:MAG: hypothetical protein IJ308_05860 [Clostridia bacterium]|nr:hypothetical protein [Clostridia bacterium]